jgi:hypothetical protein
MARRPPVLVLLVAAALLVSLLVLRPAAERAAAGGDRLSFNGDDTVRITSELRTGGLGFEPEVTPGDRDWILASIASARPEARRLIAEVDGALTFRTAGTGDAIGIAQLGPRGFRIWLNLARLNGDRTGDRATAVLHELGHVVDYALVPAELARRLDAAIPAGDPCLQADHAAPGGCSAAAERFADTFAKWALRGAVSVAGAGYMIPTPSSLEDWGAPLGALALPAA